jgi:hypothetical protein
MWLGDLSSLPLHSFVFLTIALTTRRKGIRVDVFGEKTLQGETPRIRPLQDHTAARVSRSPLLFAQPTYEFALASIRYPQYGNTGDVFNYELAYAKPFCLGPSLHRASSGGHRQGHRRIPEPFVKPGGRSPS